MLDNLFETEDSVLDDYGFVIGKYDILIHDVPQAQHVYQYYANAYGITKNSSDKENCLEFPYLCSGRGDGRPGSGVHGNSINSRPSSLDYEVWRLIINDGEDIQESDIPLSFLFE